MISYVKNTQEDTYEKIPHYTAIFNTEEHLAKNCVEFTVQWVKLPQLQCFYHKGIFILILIISFLLKFNIVVSQLSIYVLATFKDLSKPKNTGVHLNIKMPFYKYRNPHYRDYKTLLHSDVVDSYLRWMGDKAISDSVDCLIPHESQLPIYHNQDVADSLSRSPVHTNNSMCYGV